MEISFAQQDLERIDRIDADTLLLFFAEEEGPLSGLPGLVDWRLTGRLSRFLQRGWFTGAFGEKLLMPTHRRLPMSRILAFGIGDASRLLPEQIEMLGEMARRALSEAGSKSVALALPGEPDTVDEVARRTRLFRKGLSAGFGGSVVLLGDQRLLEEALPEGRGA